MSQVQNLNQFAQTPVVGQQDQTVNNNIKVVQIDPASESTKPLVAGQAFKLVDVAGEVPVVDVAAITDEIYGVAVHNMRRDTFAKGDYIELACAGSVLYLEASAAVARGAKVQNNPDTPAVATLVAGTNASIGIMLDKLTAAGIGRVEIAPENVDESNY